jgi:hypothetical protein
MASMGADQTELRGEGEGEDDWEEMRSMGLAWDWSDMRNVTNAPLFELLLAWAL